jgi:diguanylate cyclase (GGDEF)-like protein/PAS domain S-box-containing protein
MASLVLASLGYWILVSLGLALGAVQIHNAAAERQMRVVQTANVQQVEQLSTRLASMIAVPTADLAVLAREPTVAEYAAAATEVKRETLAGTLRLFVATNPPYERVAYVDNDGRERAHAYARAARAASAIAVGGAGGAGGPALRQGSGPSGRVLRFVAPVAATGRTSRDRLVLDYPVQGLVDLLAAESARSPGTLLLVDASGRLAAVTSVNPAAEATHRAPRPGDLFAERFPEAAVALGSGDSGDLVTAAGLFAVRGLDVRDGPAAIDHPARQWRLVGWVPPGLIAEETALLKQRMLLVTGLLALLALAGVVFTIVVRESIRDRSRQEQSSRSRLQAVLQTASDGIVTIDEQGMIESFNSAAERIFGWREGELIGRPVALLMPEPHRAGHQDFVREFIERGDQRVIGGLREMTAVRRDGSSFPVELSINCTEVGGKRLFTGFLRDITLRRQIDEAIRQQALSDDLTGLPNRRALLETIRRSQGAARQGGTFGALLVVDLDRFKTVNDALGHVAGDAALVEVAGRLGGMLAAETLVARLDGDGFAVIVEGVYPDESAAAGRAYQLSQSIAAGVASQPFRVGDVSLSLTVSIGVMVYPMGDAMADRLLKNADTALHRAKVNGANAFRFFHPSMEADVTERLALASDLRRALDDEEFFLVYQPKIDVGADAVAGAEALVRWMHPSRGVLGPDKFIGFAEETGLIQEIGAWTIRRAIADMQALQQQLGRAQLQHVAINISPRHFFAAGFVSDLRQVLRQTGYPAAGIELEITENLLLDNIELAERKMQNLRQLGVTIAIDDFGTGFSSLSYLRSLPVDRIKIDRTFIDAVDVVPEKAAMVQTILSLQRVRPFGFVAEGVETLGERDWLLSHGCPVIQGYLYSRPLSLADLAGFCIESDTRPVTAMTRSDDEATG